MHYPQHIARFHGFGATAVPTGDAATTSAAALLLELDRGGDGSQTLGALDAATRSAVCQRAMAVLNLPQCPAGQYQAGNEFTASGGTCINWSSFSNTATNLKMAVASACNAQGVPNITPTTGAPSAGLSPYAWLGIAAVAAGVAWYLFGPEL